MDTRAEKMPPRAAPVALDVATDLLSLGEVAVALPWRIALAVRALLQPGSATPGRDGIAVPPMSGEWLQRSAADWGKRGEPF